VASAPSVQLVLSGGFRDTQAALGRTASGAVERFWNAGFTIKDVRSAWDTIRPYIATVLRRQFAASQEAGRIYYNASRVSAGLAALPASYEPASLTLTDDWLGKTIDPGGIGSFLQYVGNGAQMIDAFDMARGNLSSVSQNLVLSGGRIYVENASKADPRSDGMRRILESSDPCDFCQSLADQGVMPSAGGFHNNCECESEPSFGA